MTVKEDRPDLVGVEVRGGPAPPVDVEVPATTTEVKSKSKSGVVATEVVPVAPPAPTAEAKAAEVKNDQVIADAAKGAPALVGVAPKTKGHIYAAATGRPMAGWAEEENSRAGVPTHDEMGRVILPLPDFSGDRVRAASTDTDTAAVGADEVGAVMWFNRTFPMMCSARLGVMMRTVEVGTQRMSYIATGTTAVAAAEGTAPTPEEVTADEIDGNPTRITASADVTTELLARSPGIEAAVRYDIMASVMDQIEDRVIDSLNGAVPGSTTAQSSVATHNDVVSLASAMIDGVYAGALGDISLLTTSRGFSFADGLYTASGEYSALERLMAKTGGVMVSDHLANPANISSKQYADFLGFTPLAGEGVNSIGWRGLVLDVDRWTTRGATMRMYGFMMHFAESSELGSGKARHGAIVRSRHRIQT